MNGKMVKNGGNVASYFCTPEGRLIHAVGGPVAATELLGEAQWAVKVALEMQKIKRWNRADFLRNAHEVASGSNSPNVNRRHGWSEPARTGQAHTHRLLARHAYLPMAQVEATLFRSLADKPFESDRSAVLSANQAFDNAAKKKRPVLLVLRNISRSSQVGHRREPAAPFGPGYRDLQTKRLLKKFAFVSLPKTQLAAFTNLRDLVGWDDPAISGGSGWHGRDTYLVVHPSGRILMQLDLGRSDFGAQLRSALERWESELEPKPDKLVSGR